MVRLLTLSGLFLLLAAPTASAGVREKILRECQEGRITGDYTPGQLRDARKNIPTDIDEYSDCRDVLARAALSGRSSGGGGNGGTGGGGTAAPGGVLPGGGNGELTYANGKGEEKDLVDALESAPGGADVGGEHLVPGASGLAADAARHGLPTTLLTALVLIGLCALAAAAPAVRRRVIARRQP
jgi:hypothetical protein